MPLAIVAATMAFGQTPAKDPRQLLQSAVTAEKTGNTQSAIGQFRAILAGNPPVEVAGQARLELVRIHQTRAEWREAAEQLQELRKLSPGNAEYAYQLGVVYRNISKFAFERIQSIAPASARAQQIFGEQYSIAGNTEKAIAAFRSATEADPKLAGSHLALAMLYLRLEQRDKAKAEIEKEMEIAPESAVAKQVRRAITEASR